MKTASGKRGRDNKMAHLLDQPGALSRTELLDRAQHAPTAVERRRWQIILLLMEQTPLAEIVATTGYRPRTIRQIAQRYREQGPAALVDQRRRSAGAAPLLTAAQQQELRLALQHLPTDGSRWTGPKVGRWIEAKTGQRVHRQRGWEYWRQLRPV
jgi:transposase